ncbi:MAG: M14 family metallopeptidase [Gemmatimonadota bacterium]|nr:M14 family metallopeptidase [Gemmatimonadota bacterium]
MHRMSCRVHLLVVLLFGVLFTQARAQEIPSPLEFFGHEMGADRQLARWDRLVEYYDLIGSLSDRIDVRHVGESTLGNPFLIIFASSPENLANLDEIRALNALLQDPRGASEAEIENAIENGKTVVVQSYGLHSTEVAASQASAEIIYLMATRTDSEMMRILDETVAIQIPNFNPDGNHIVTDWYDRWVGTEYEAAGLPELYHHYIGHDNNRDAFMQNTVESRYGAEIMFREWIPQAYIDHHQMGGYTARMYVPPYAEPIRPEADPLVWREMSWAGAQIAAGLEAEGREGIVNAAIYSGWGHFGFHWITPFHNIAGMLTESASARLATPLYVHPEELGGSRQLPEYEAQTTFPNPWKGGWWTVRDIVINQRIATFEMLDIAARNRDRLLRNAFLKASRQVERGRTGDIRAFVIPAEQHDPLTARKMIDKLLLQGIEVQRASTEFTHDGRVYGTGSYVVSMAQPKRGVIRWLLGRTFYPQNSYTRQPDGSPIRPYDMSGDVLAEFMGVRVDQIDSDLDAALSVISDVPLVAGSVSQGSEGYHVSANTNDAFRAVNLLLAEGATVRRFTRDHGPHAAGSFWISGADEATVRAVAGETGVDFDALNVDAGAEFTTALEAPRIGLFQRYLGGNMDEGWTRLLLEQFDFPYETVMDADVLSGELGDRFDVIVLPADDLDDMTGEGQDLSDVPPEYRSGFGEAGVAALEAFVEGGGRLVTFAEAGDLAIEGFDLPVRNIVDGVPNTEFWAHGSTLRVDVHGDHPLAAGMPDEALVVFFGDNQVYEVVRGGEGERVRRVASYVDRDILQSGQLDGEEIIADRAAMVTVEHGEGDVVLIGFRTQHRAQTHGTYKFLFNALLGGGAVDPGGGGVPAG